MALETLLIATDGSACSDNQNMFGALRLAALLSHARTPDFRRWLSADEAFRMATLNGARALGLGDDAGAIEPGRLADLVLVDLGSVYLRPLNVPLYQLVYAEIGSAVHTVLVDGRVVVRAGRMVEVDEDALLGEASAAMERQRGQSTEAMALAEAIEPHLAELHLERARQPYPVNRYADGNSS
jgi:guanine deaminase